MKQTRKEAHDFGLAAERICALALTCKGYRVLALRHRNAGGEIDLVAARRGLLVVVEVKARRSCAHNADAVPPHKRQRLARAASALLAEPRFAALATRPDFGVRFDVMWVNPWRWPRHEKNAFRIDF